ncbi:hypothetical protein ACLF6K_02770 [Streptomyces xanthophaeus]|uniref:hypothetical protein n=1 Tax=Streptomyces xanthophaeus TaxID=67385 RepID=UPI00398FB447
MTSKALRRAAAAAAGTLMLSGLAAAPAVAAPAAPLACAQLTGQSYGTAYIKNTCSYAISASVQIDWAGDPGCIWINPGRTGTIHWDGADGRANYAYQC